MIELDDTYVGGKRGLGADGKRPVLVAVETRTKGAGFATMQAVDTISKETVRDFLTYHLKEGQTIRTDAFSALNAIAEKHFHAKKKSEDLHIIQVAGSTRQIDNFLDNIGRENIVEIARTGVSALEKQL